MAGLVEWIEKRWPFGLDLEEEITPYWEKSLGRLTAEAVESLKVVILERHKYKRAPNLAEIREWKTEAGIARGTKLTTGIAAGEWRLWTVYTGEMAWCESMKHKLNDPVRCLECEKLPWNCQLSGQCPADSTRKFVVTQDYLDAMALTEVKQQEKAARNLLAEASKDIPGDFSDQPNRRY